LNACLSLMTWLIYAIGGYSVMMRPIIR